MGYFDGGDGVGVVVCGDVAPGQVVDELDEVVLWDKVVVFHVEYAP